MEGIGKALAKIIEFIIDNRGASATRNDLLSNDNAMKWSGPRINLDVNTFY